MQLLEAMAAVLAAVWLVALVHAVWSQARTRGRVAELGRIAAQEAPPLAEGAARVVGTVIAPADDVVARTTIEQVGTKKRHRGNRWIDWNEVDRRTSFVPFTVQTAHGPVGVEATTAALRTLDLVTEPIDALRRRRVATVFGGQRVLVAGRLERRVGAGAYRGAARWVLVPDGTRITISTVPLGATASSFEAFYAAAARWLALGALVVPLVWIGALWISRVDSPGLRRVLGQLATLMVVATVMMPFAYGYRLRALRPWWRRARVQERTPGWPT